jgi:hypothetical protein
VGLSACSGYPDTPKKLLRECDNGCSRFDIDHLFTTGTLTLSD